MAVTLSSLPSAEDLKRWGFPHALDFHPVMTAPTEELMARLGPKAAVEWLKRRHQAIQLEKDEPLDHGWQLPLWERIQADIADMRAVGHGVIIVLVLGGNRGGKSKGAARLFNRILRDKPGARGLHLHSKQDIARQTTMPYLFETIPLAWRPAPGKPSTGRHAVHRVSYTQGTGFADDVYVFPNGSQANFGYYGNDLSTVEGPEYDVIWADELIPLKWVKTLRYRLATRKGVFIITFTPVDGFTPTVAHFWAGAETIARSPLMPPDRLRWEGGVIGRHACELPIIGEGGRVDGYGEIETEGAAQVVRGLPRIMQCADPAARIYFAWTQDNLYNPYEETAKLSRPGGREEIKTRLYGLATRIASIRFQLTAAHRLLRDRVSMLPRTGSFYHIVDPCEGRTWAMWWVYVVGRRAYVLREFPQPGQWPFAARELSDELRRSDLVRAGGQWVTLEPPGDEKRVRFDGYRGPAQTSLRWGLSDYRDEILRIERELFRLLNPETPEESLQKVVPWVRIMDSRAGNSPTLAATAATTLIAQMATLEGGEPLFFAPAGGGSVKSGLNLLDDWFAYDRTRPVDYTNEPRLLIHEDCTNTLACMGIWTGADGEKGAAKDFIDVACYFAKACHAVPDGLGETEDGGGW